MHFQAVRVELSLEKIFDPHWGMGDLLEIDGAQVWLLYFTCTQALEELEQILTGKQLDRAEDGYYYPIGRLATWQNLQVLYDPHGFIQSLQDRLTPYPVELGERLFAYHTGKLSDTEDLERAVQRRDVLFYHFALDIALDHFLQALFALNRVYFPSRKRSLQYIHAFPHQPAECAKRLLDLVRLGGEEAGLEDSYRIWQQLSAALLRMVGDPPIE